MTHAVAVTVSDPTRRSTMRAGEGLVPGRYSHGTFTAADLAAVNGLGEDVAERFLAEFVTAGVVERVAGGWRLTPWGAGLARDLARCTGADRD